MLNGTEVRKIKKRAARISGGASTEYIRPMELAKYPRPGQHCDRNEVTPLVTVTTAIRTASGGGVDSHDAFDVEIAARRQWLAAIGRGTSQ